MKIKIDRFVPCASSTSCDFYFFKTTNELSLLFTQLDSFDSETVYVLRECFFFVMVVFVWLFVYFHKDWWLNLLLGQRMYLQSFVVEITWWMQNRWSLCLAIACQIMNFHVYYFDTIQFIRTYTHVPMNITLTILCAIGIERTSYAPMVSNSITQRKKKTTFPSHTKGKLLKWNLATLWLSQSLMEFHLIS